MLRRLLALTLTLTVTIAVADQQSHDNAAKELLEVMNADQAIEMAYEQMYTHMSGMAEQLGITEDTQPMFDIYLEKMVEVMKEEMNWDKMEPYILSAYVSVYSEDELRELSEFYSSPLGQKFVSKMPELMEASMKMTQEMMGVLLPRLTEIQKELHAEVKKEQANQ